MARIDMELWTPFVKLWGEAAEAGLGVDELAALSGVKVETLRSRQIALRRRGILLPLLRNQRGPRTEVKKSRVIKPVVAAPKCSIEPMVIYVM